MITFNTGGNMQQPPDDKMDSLKEILRPIVGDFDKKILGALLVNFGGLYTREALVKIVATQMNLDPRLVEKEMEEATKIFWQNY